jgi:hypothetical protein
MSRRRFDTPCTVEIACDADSVHAHVDLGAVEIGPADRVRVHEAPARIAFGERTTLHTRATVTRATALERLVVRAMAGLALGELYEVSFSPGGLR